MARWASRIAAAKRDATTAVTDWLAANGLPGEVATAQVVRERPGGPIRPSRGRPPGR
jgi:hypothetical protein